MKTKMLLLGLVLFIVGVALVVSTVHEEKVGDVAEDPHLEVPATGYYEVHSSNATLTFVGVVLAPLGLILSIIGWRWK